MEILKTKIIASRALNASRKLHLPTYVATRFLLETIVGNDDSSWIYEVIPRKCLIQKHTPFYKTLKFKKVGEHNKPEYREFVVPSPTTLLVEAILLGYFSQTEQFKKSDRVYSYIWPASLDCPYNFEHYISGYKKRNDDIASYLSLNDGKILIVSDIEKFYPNINQEIIKRRFGKRVESSSLPLDIKSLAYRLLNDLCAFFPDGIGITTGSEFSHVIGDIALQEFDDVLSEKYKDAYFRYVDDIVLIIDPEDKEETIELLESLAKKEKLTIHPDKNDVLTSDAWLKYGPHNEHSVKKDSFESLVFNIKTYLQINPDNESNLDNALNKAGFSIPLGRLSLTSKSSEFVSKLIGLMNLGWNVALKAIRANEQDLLQQAAIVRTKLYSDLIQYTESTIPEGSTLRKWHLQKLRYLTNRAVYLLPHEQLAFLIPKLKGIPEFVDTVAMLKILVEGDYSELLNMPGAALTACAGLLSQM